MRTSRLFLTGILTASLLVLGLPAASADTIDCGATITADVMLTSDLTCSGDGIVVGADGVTIDLGGFSLIGSGTDTGILVDDPGNDYTVTLRNGTIDGFGIGIDHWGHSAKPEMTVDRVNVINNGTGVQVYGAALSMIRSSVTGNGTGILLEVSDAEIRFSHVDSNGAGIVRASSGLVDVRDSTISHNGTGFFSSQADRTTVVGSDLVDNHVAFSLDQSRNNHIERNRISGSDLGISLEDVECQGNVIINNRFSDNRIGIQIGDPDFGLWVGDGTEITKNTFTDNGEAGLAINLEVGSAQGVIVSGNMFHGNGFDSASAINDGLHISGVESLLTQITVSGNKAHRNADYGIEALGVTDGGKNKANNNGNPDQCLGVDC